MTNVGTVSIKIEADTSDLEKGVKRAKRSMSETEREATKMRRSAARWEAAAGAATVGGVAARRFGGLPGQTFGGFLKRQLAAAGIRVVAGGLAGGLAGAAMMLATRRGRGGAGSAAQRDSTDSLLTSLLAETVKQNRSMEDIAASARRARDPYQRGLAYQQERMAALGILPDRRRANRMSRLQIARDEAAAARSRFFQDLRPGFLDSFLAGIAESRAGFWASMNQFQASRRNFFGIGGGSNPASRQGTLFTQRGPTGGSWSPQMYQFGGTAGNARDAAFFEQQRRTALREQMIALQTLGAPQLLQGSPTIQAGGESEYQWRVGRQRERLQLEATRTYQNQVLELLRKMVDTEQATREQVREQEIRMNPQVAAAE